ncbi:hypothetical protein BDN72DRAFT_860464 [Pluteus cervinus]|uniref:Uncharacterized protein n=1 Tax=Pluteus cervinus TaxID=181527 RepID=A0ACD3AII1_9AGAR|nr:hypothetical protein BDN72DRAFT_860464 [Pluteus cervinus]
MKFITSIAILALALVAAADDSSPDSSAVPDASTSLATSASDDVTTSVEATSVPDDITTSLTGDVTTSVSVISTPATSVPDVKTTSLAGSSIHGLNTSVISSSHAAAPTGKNNTGSAFATAVGIEGVFVGVAAGVAAALF